jgi:rhamnosyltransferase
MNYLVFKEASSLEKVISSSQIALIMVTFNPDIELLKKILDKLQKEHAFKFVISDNASHNLSGIKRLCQIFPKIHLLTHSKNAGIGRAQNDALRFIFQKFPGVEYFCFLDQDGYLAPTDVITLCQDLEKLQDQKAAIIGSNLQVPFLKWQLPTQQRYHQTYEVISSGSVIKKAAFAKLGLFYDKLFIDFIDYEWCWRARKQGYRVFVDSQVYLHHQLNWKKSEIRHGKNVIAAFRLYYVFRNGLYLMHSGRMLNQEINHWKADLWQQFKFNVFYCPHRLQRLTLIIKGYLASRKLTKANYLVSAITHSKMSSKSNL